MDIDLSLAENPSKVHGIGARLKEIRESMHFSEKDVAARLHLSVKFVEIMENEDFSNGPPKTFMRGYLRSYMRLLNISEEEISTILEELGMGAPSATGFGKQLHIPLFENNDRYTNWLTYLIVLVLFILIGMWWTSRSHEPASDNKNTSTTASPNPEQMAPPSATSLPTVAPAPPNTTPSVPNTTNNVMPLNNTEAPANNPIQLNNSVNPSATQPEEKNDVNVSTNPADDNSEEENKQNLTEMPMSVPEPGLDTSDDGREDYDYTN